MAGRLAFLQSQAIAPSTRRAYQAGLRKYTTFCYSRQWNPLPASEVQLRYFASWLADQVSFPTIKLYLAGIRFTHIENSLVDPFADAPLLHLLLRGIKRTKGLSSCCRLPITMSVMRQLKGALASDPQITSRDKLMLWSAFTLAFFAFSRSSEFTSPSSTRFNSRVHLCFSDISFTTTGSLSLQLKLPKLTPSGKGVSLLSPLLVGQSVQYVPCAGIWIISLPVVPALFISFPQGNSSPGTKLPLSCASSFIVWALPQSLTLPTVSALGLLLPLQRPAYPPGLSKPLAVGPAPATPSTSEPLHQYSMLSLPD